MYKSSLELTIDWWSGKSQTKLSNDNWRHRSCMSTANFWYVTLPTKPIENGQLELNSVGQKGNPIAGIQWFLLGALGTLVVDWTQKNEAAKMLLRTGRFEHANQNNHSIQMKMITSMSWRRRIMAKPSSARYGLCIATILQPRHSCYQATSLHIFLFIQCLLPDKPTLLNQRSHSDTYSRGLRNLLLLGSVHLTILYSRNIL